MKAEVLDRLIDEFAPGGGAGQELPGRRQDLALGSPDLEIGRFFVAWNPSQLDGIFSKAKRDDGAYVAYMGPVDDERRDLLSAGLKGLEGFAIRSVDPIWRCHSWGIANKIARDLGVDDARPVITAGREPDHKVVTFVPEDKLPKVRESVFAAGGGKHGLYSRCSFSSAGTGTFFGEKGSRPAYGKPGKLEEIEERRLEVLVPADRLGRVVAALKKAHPYEEPVVETYRLAGGTDFGEGRIGHVDPPLGSAEASRKLVSVLGSRPAYLSGDSRCSRLLVWDGEPQTGLHEAMLADVELYIGPASGGLAKLMGSCWRTEVVEFPGYCFL
ncbi:MAG: hypothetical protein PVH52_02630, partial [bacterium]